LRSIASRRRNDRPHSLAGAREKGRFKVEFEPPVGDGLPQLGNSADRSKCLESPRDDDVDKTDTEQTRVVLALESQ
jgi:hypothetical protein